MSDGIPWSTVRTAIRGWVVSGATPDIAANHVIWAGQQKAVPDGMYITIDLEAEQDHGFDAQSYVDVAGVCTQHATGPRTVTIVIIVYGGVQQNDATVPCQIASRIRSRISLSTVNDALSAANVGILNWTSVTTPGRGLNSSVFEPRAMFSVDVSLISDVSTVVDVIATINISGTPGDSFRVGPPPIIPMIFGGPSSDSNGIGQDIAPDEWDETFDPVTEIVAVPWRMKYSQAVGDGTNPPPYQTDITTGGIRPYNVNGVPNTGWRQTFAQEAVRAGYVYAQAEFAISGIKALQCTPTVTFPTGGPNVWTQGMAWADASETTFSARTVSTVDFIGGNDGFISGDASSCNASLTAIVNGKIAKWGAGIKLIMFRQPDFQAIASTVPFLSTIQAAQDAVAAAFPSNVVQIPTADASGHSDHLHLDGNSSAIAGQRAFFAHLDAHGIARVRPAAPQIVGWAPQYVTLGAASYSPIPPGCGIPGDLEIVWLISQMAAGTNNAIGAPTVATGGTPWTAIGTQIVSSQSGTTSRLAIFARAVTANRATAATPLTTVPSNGNTINGGRIITVRGPNALTVANIDLVQLSKNDAFATSLPLTGGTAGFADGLIAFAGGYRTNATSNPVTMAGVVGLTRAFGGNRAAGPGGDFITNAAWQTTVAPGVVAGITATFALPTLAVGAVLGIKP